MLVSYDSFGNKKYTLHQDSEGDTSNFNMKYNIIILLCIYLCIFNLKKTKKASEYARESKVR